VVNPTDPAPSERLLEVAYAELRSLADAYLRRERSDHTLQPTALVNEAWMRLADQSGVEWEGRSHFLAVAAMAMRRVLVDHARARKRDKRGGGAEREPLQTQFPSDFEIDVDLLALNEGLDALKEHSARAAQVVELRFFAGLSEDEAAGVLGVDRSTAKRDWRLARAWLSDWLNRGEPS
jgi:RNA polymerase sigma factor (TIGR02999 family)